MRIRINITFYFLQSLLSFRTVNRDMDDLNVTIGGELVSNEVLFCYNQTLLVITNQT